MTTTEQAARPEPILTIRPGSHDRHSILYRLWFRVHALHGRGQETSAVLLHAAHLMLECDCREGRKLRGAIRGSVEESHMSRSPIRIQADGGQPHFEGKGPRVKWLPGAQAKQTAESSPRGKRRAYVPTTRRIVVGPEWVLALAGWPDHATGLDTSPKVSYPEGAQRLPVIPPDSAA